MNLHGKITKLVSLGQIKEKETLTLCCECIYAFYSPDDWIFLFVIHSHVVINLAFLALHIENFAEKQTHHILLFDNCYVCLLKVNEFLLKPSLTYYIQEKVDVIMLRCCIENSC